MVTALFGLAPGQYPREPSTGEEAVRLWDMESFQELLTLPAQNPTFITTQFSPDGNVLGAMDFKAKLHLWRAPSWAEIERAEN